MHTNTHEHMCMHTLTHTHMYMHIHIHMDKSTHAYIHKCTHHICKYTHRHTHLCAHTYTTSRKFKFFIENGIVYAYSHIYVHNTLIFYSLTIVTLWPLIIVKVLYVWQKMVILNSNANIYTAIHNHSDSTTSLHAILQAKSSRFNQKIKAH